MLNNPLFSSNPAKEVRTAFNKDEAHWHLINYDWLTKFLKENMYRRTPVDSILKDVYIEFSGDDEEEGYFDH